MKKITPKQVNEIKSKFKTIASKDDLLVLINDAKNTEIYSEKHKYMIEKLKSSDTVFNYELLKTNVEESEDLYNEISKFIKEINDFDTKGIINTIELLKKVVFLQLKIGIFIYL